MMTMNGQMLALGMILAMASGCQRDRSNDDGSTTKVIGGLTTSMAGKDAVRQVVKVLHNSVQECSGVLIKPNMVLTADHCTFAYPNSSNDFSPDSLRVDVVRDDQKNFDRYQVQGIMRYRNNHDWLGRAVNNTIFQPSADDVAVDLAVLVLNQPVKAFAFGTDLLDGLDLPKPHEAEQFLKGHKKSGQQFRWDDAADEGTEEKNSALTFSAIGFGNTADSDSSSNHPGSQTKVNVPFRGYFGQYNEELHAGTIKKGPCSGDSGSPLLALTNNKLYIMGILSRTFTADASVYCSQTDGSIYTNVSSAKAANAWIANLIDVQ